jgi:alkanesulfonate monooxygenase SsuD/methylene tetrahydromethanopterin reductase-like flavin-dependent oxidoreductase (luciferase family)
VERCTDGDIPGNTQKEGKIMEWGIAINLREHLSEIIEKAKIADTGGMDTIWVTDYPATRYSPALASNIAQNTSKSRIGVGLLSPLIYSPTHIIQMMKTLITTHGERFDLLLGPGDRSQLQSIGINYGDISTLVTRIHDSATSIREALTEYNTRIFMGAQGRKMIEACTCADGVLLNYSDPEMIQWAISKLDNQPKNFKIGIFPPSLIGISQDCKNEKGIKRSAAVVALGLNYSIMKEFGLLNKLRPVADAMREAGLTNQLVEEIGQDILSRFCLCGSIETNTSRLEEYQQMGVEMIVFGPPQGATLEGVRQIVAAKSAN